MILRETVFHVVTAYLGQNSLCFIKVIGILVRKKQDWREWKKRLGHFCCIKEIWNSYSNPTLCSLTIFHFYDPFLRPGEMAFSLREGFEGCSALCLQVESY